MLVVAVMVVVVVVVADVVVSSDKCGTSFMVGVID